MAKDIQTKIFPFFGRTDQLDVSEQLESSPEVRRKLEHVKDNESLEFLYAKVVVVGDSSSIKSALIPTTSDSADDLEKSLICDSYTDLNFQTNKSYDLCKHLEALEAHLVAKEMPIMDDKSSCLIDCLHTVGVLIWIAIGAVIRNLNCAISCGFSHWIPFFIHLFRNKINFSTHTIDFLFINIWIISNLTIFFTWLPGSTDFVLGLVVQLVVVAGIGVIVGVLFASGVRVCVYIALIGGLYQQSLQDLSTKTLEFVLALCGLALARVFIQSWFQEGINKFLFEGSRKRLSEIFPSVVFTSVLFLLAFAYPAESYWIKFLLWCFVYFRMYAFVATRPAFLGTVTRHCLEDFTHLRALYLSIFIRAGVYIWFMIYFEQLNAQVGWVLVLLNATLYCEMRYLLSGSLFEHFCMSTYLLEKHSISSVSVNPGWINRGITLSTKVKEDALVYLLGVHSTCVVTFNAEQLITEPEEMKKVLDHLHKLQEFTWYEGVAILVGEYREENTKTRAEQILKDEVDKHFPAQLSSSKCWVVKAGSLQLNSVYDTLRSAVQRPTQEVLMLNPNERRLATVFEGIRKDQVLQSYGDLVVKMRNNGGFKTEEIRNFIDVLGNAGIFTVREIKKYRVVIYQGVALARLIQQLSSLDIKETTSTLSNYVDALIKHGLLFENLLDDKLEKLFANACPKLVKLLMDYDCVMVPVANYQHLVLTDESNLPCYIFWPCIPLQLHSEHLNTVKYNPAKLTSKTKSFKVLRNVAVPFFRRLVCIFMRDHKQIQLKQTCQSCALFDNEAEPRVQVIFDLDTSDPSSTRIKLTLRTAWRATNLILKHLEDSVSKAAKYFPEHSVPLDGTQASGSRRSALNAPPQTGNSTSSGSGLNGPTARAVTRSSSDACEPSTLTDSSVASQSYQTTTGSNASESVELSMPSRESVSEVVSRSPGPQLHSLSSVDDTDADAADSIVLVNQQDSAVFRAGSESNQPVAQDSLRGFGGEQREVPRPIEVSNGSVPPQLALEQHPSFPPYSLSADNSSAGSSANLAIWQESGVNVHVDSVAFQPE